VFLPHAVPLPSGTHSAMGGQGARMHWTCLASQWVPALQRTVAQGSSLGASGTQVGCGGQGARMHCTSCSSQCVPAAHFTVLQEGALMHWALPLMSSQMVPTGQVVAAHELSGMHLALPLLSSQRVPAMHNVTAQLGPLGPPASTLGFVGTGLQTAAPATTSQIALGGQLTSAHGDSSGGTQWAPLGVSIHS
jgi:hypothetical protein